MASSPKYPNITPNYTLEWDVWGKKMPGEHMKKRKEEEYQRGRQIQKYTCGKEYMELFVCSL